MPNAIATEIPCFKLSAGRANFPVQLWHVSVTGTFRAQRRKTMQPHADDAAQRLMRGPMEVVLTPTSPVMQWPRANRALLATLAVSLLLHALATVGTLAWRLPVDRTAEVRFDAVLSLPPRAETTQSMEKLTPLPTSPTKVQRNARQKTRTPKSAAIFAAPENAIAVEPSTSDLVDDPASSVMATDRAQADTTAGLASATAVQESSAANIESSAPTSFPAPMPTPLPPVELPSRVTISYNATSSIADGVARYVWNRNVDSYTFESTIQASGFFAEMFAGTLTQHSTGAITPTGIAPTLFTIRRGDRQPETAEFQPATNEVRLSRGGESRQVAMPPNLQDTQSFLFQLAIEAPKLKTPEDRVTINVTNARGINRYTFKKVGESSLETRMGIVDTVHLAREITDPSDGYEVWVSPKHHYLPIKLKFFMGRFPAELIATTITSAP